jgi:hypothetical protein
METRKSRSDTEERLRAASDAIQLAVVELREIEAQKRSVEPGNEQFADLTKRVRGSAEHLLELARVEESFANGLAGASPADVAPIERVAPPHDLQQILAEWRAVERELDAAHPGSQEAHRLLVRFEELRAEYMRVLDEKRS